MLSIRGADESPTDWFVVLVFDANEAEAFLNVAWFGLSRLRHVVCRDALDLCKVVEVQYISVLSCS